MVNGQIDGAHCLYSMPAALATLGNQPDHPLRIAMMLNRNGQAITLNAKDFDGVGYADLAGFRSKLEAKPDKLAMTYPGGTHDLWLRYVLKAANRGMPRPSPMGSVSRLLRPKISGRTIPRRPSWSAPS